MNRTDCPSKFELARFDAQGRVGAWTAHVESCARCGAALRELDEARDGLFGADPALATRAAARRILDEVAARKDRRLRRIWRWLAPAALVPLAAGALVLAAGRGQTPHAPVDGTHALEAAGLTQERVKGPLVLEAFCKRGERTFPVASGDAFQAGDRLRFAYSKPASGYLMIFGVDDGRAVFPYYPDGKLGGLPVQPGARVMLPDSIELDDHRGKERIFALWSDRPFEGDRVKRALDEALEKVGGDLTKLDKLPVPGVEQVSYLLRKP
jgi:hypothetical protein